MSYCILFRFLLTILNVLIDFDPLVILSKILSLKDTFNITQGIVYSPTNELLQKMLEETMFDVFNGTVYKRVIAENLFVIHSEQNRTGLFKNLRKGTTFVGVEFPDYYAVIFFYFSM